jgi:ankyrin repeat protein
MAGQLTSHSVLLLIIVCIQSVSAQSIHDGVREDSPEKIKQTLAAGADINTIGQGGQTPLMNAVLSGKTAAVDFLLKQGADTKIGEKDGYTPMHGAGFQGRAEIAKLLIAHGLDASDRHSDGYVSGGNEWFIYIIEIRS